MAELTTLARPYAKAAFEYADNAGTLDSWSKTLSELSLVVNDSKVANLLSNPLNTTDQNTEVLTRLMGDDLDAKMKNFVSNLSANKRLALLGEISALFDLMKANREQTLDVKIQTAYELTDAQKSTLSETLSGNLKRQVALEVEADESLIGGVLIHAGDTLIDGSVKGRLAKLTDAIAH